MANAGNQRIIPLEEGWNDEIKAKVRKWNRYGCCNAAAEPQHGVEGAVFFSNPVELALRFIFLACRAPRSSFCVSSTFHDAKRFHELLLTMLPLHALLLLA